MTGTHRSSLTGGLGRRKLSAVLFAASFVGLIAGVSPLHAAGPASISLATPARVEATLYDQYDNPGTHPITSQEFEPQYNTYDSEAADDFVVPAGASWNIGGVDVQGTYYNVVPVPCSVGCVGPADSVNIRFYENRSDNLPYSLVCERLHQPYTGGANFVIQLSQPCSIGPGHYWLSVQARQDFDPHGLWGWTPRTVQSNAGAAWREPNTWTLRCQGWGRRTQCIPGVPDPDQVYRLRGTVGPPPPPPDVLHLRG